jgi:flavin-dependent dehydrogenase
VQIPSRCDVVVIGGGPAGSMASGMLAKAGFEVVLLEKARHPRPTVGESLLPHFWNHVDMLGVTAEVEAARFVEKAGAMVLWGSSLRRSSFKDFGHTRMPLHVDRDCFDKILLDGSARLGVSVFERVQATRVELGGSENKRVFYKCLDEDGEGSIEASFVVDASGQSALIAKQEHFRIFDEDLRFSAAWGYYTGGEYLDFESEIRPISQLYTHPPVTVVAALGDWGWAWHIPLRETTSVGIILTPERWKEIGAGAPGMEAKFLRAVEASPIVGKLVGNAQFIEGSASFIRDYAYKPERLAVDGCYLVGDAAAFVDPINSAGVTFGMYAGILAAWSIEMSMKKRERSARYQEIFERQYLERLRLFRLLAVPADRTYGDEDMQAALKSLRAFSDEEKLLALTTSFLTNRSERIVSLFEQLDLKAELRYGEFPIPERLR